VTQRARSNRSALVQGLVSTLLLACLALGAVVHAQNSTKATQVAAASGPAWSELTPAQQSALAPLKKDWPTIDASRKQKWLEIAARFPSMPAEERQRIQQRMNEWARMTPDERGRARLQFQEARQISPQQRQERWDAYMALPADERRALAASARTVPKSGSPSGDAAARKADGRGTASPQAATKIVAPTLVQAKPGASTTLISKPATPPPHAQAGQPKIAVDKGKVDRSTLLPQAAPKGAAASAPQ
jgi:hypothetical protein